MNNTELKELLARLETATGYLVKNKKATAEYRAGFLAALDSVKEAIK